MPKNNVASQLLFNRTFTPNEQVPIKIKNEKVFEPKMPKVPINQLPEK